MIEIRDEFPERVKSFRGVVKENKTFFLRSGIPKYHDEIQIHSREAINNNTHIKYQELREKY